MKISGVEKIFLFLINLAFLSLYFLLSYHIRITVGDDFTFISVLNKYGWSGSLIHLYKAMSFRWTSFIYLNTILSFGNSSLNFVLPLLLYYTISIVLFIYSIYSIITSMFNYYFFRLPSFFIRLNYAVLFCSSFYFATFQAIEVWFWTCASFVYLQSIIASCLGISFLLKEESSVFKNIAIAFCFLYVGGASETNSLFILLILIICSFYFLIKEKFNFRKFLLNNYAKNSLIAFVFLCLSILVNITAEGSLMRKGMEFSIRTTSTKIYPNIHFYEAKQLITIFLQKKEVVFLLLTFIWIILGSHVSASEKNTKIELSLKKLLLASIALIFICLLSIIIPSHYVFGDFGPIRAWMPFNFLLVILGALWSFFFGYKVRIFQKHPLRRPLLLCLPLLIILSMYLIRQYPLVTKYADAYDKRIEHLKTFKHKGWKETVELSPLPPSGMLVDRDITEDENSSLNQSFKEALNLPFNVKLKKIQKGNKL